jgi:hypothetical protein
MEAIENDVGTWYLISVGGVRSNTKAEGNHADLPMAFFYPWLDV